MITTKQRRILESQQKKRLGSKVLNMLKVLGIPTKNLVQNLITTKKKTSEIKATALNKHLITILVHKYPTHK